MKNELGRKFMTEFVGLRPEIYSYLINDKKVVIKRPRKQKKYVIKRKLKLSDNKKLLTEQ